MPDDRGRALDALAAEVADLRRKLGAARSGGSGDERHLLAEHRRLQELAAATDVERARLHAEVKRHTDDIAALRTELDRLRSESAMAVAVAQRQSAEQERVRAELAQQLTEAGKAVEQLRDERDRATAQLRRVYDLRWTRLGYELRSVMKRPSTCWRLPGRIVRVIRRSS